jgi:hypothetical protein
MKTRKRWWELLVVITLTFLSILTGCPNGNDGDDNNGPANDNVKLLGKWKAQNDTSDSPRIVFEFLDSGMVVWDGSIVSYLYEGTSLKLSSVTGTAALSGDTLYLSGFGAGTDGTYTRVGGSNNGEGTGDGNLLKITGLPSDLPSNMAEYGLSLFDNYGRESIIAEWRGSVTNGEISLELLLLEPNMMAVKPWTGTGDYGVVIFMPGSQGDIALCYLDGASPSSIHGPASLPKLNFNSGVTTVPFSKFGEVPLENFFGGGY